MLSYKDINPFSVPAYLHLGCRGMLGNCILIIIMFYSYAQVFIVGMD